MTSPGQRELYTRAPFRGFLKDPDTDKASWSVIQSEKSEIQNCLRCQSILWHVSIYEMSCSLYFWGGINFSGFFLLTFTHFQQARLEER
jgi:hypothetical protein